MHLAKGISKLSLSKSTTSDNNDFSISEIDHEMIKSINYEELESKYQIQKYYPSYIHNYDVSTPVLKDLILDKPIYNDANKHVKKQKQKQKLSDCKRAKQVLKESRQLRKDQRDERRNLKKEHKQERSNLKQQQRSYNGHFMQKTNSLNCNKIENECNNGQTNPYQLAAMNRNDSRKTEIIDPINSNGEDDSDSDATEVEDEVNTLMFKNPFEQGKKLTVDHYLDNSNNMSRTNSNNMSRTNSIKSNYTHLPNSMMMTQSNSMNQRRSSSTTLFHNSQNSSMNYNNNSIASKFMNIFNTTGNNDFYKNENTSQDSMLSGSFENKRRNSSIPLNLHQQQQQQKHVHQHNNEEMGYKLKHQSMNVAYESYPIEKSLSFDQSKSTKTMLKQKLRRKLGSELNRRYSDQIGMYKFMLLT